MKKEIVRQNVLNIRRSLSRREIEEKSDKIRNLLLSFSLFKKAKMILFYISLPKEVQTHRMIDDALKMGKRIAVPVVDFVERQIIPFEIKSSRCKLVKGPFNIYEPDESQRYPVSVEEIKLVIVPGVAFDRRGGRVGFGGGFYDRFLIRLSSQVKSIALAFKCQLVDKVPCEEHDVTVDYVITEEEIIFCKNEGGINVS